MGIPLDHTIFTHLATLRTLSEPHYRIHTKQDQLDLYLPQSYKLQLSFVLQKTIVNRNSCFALEGKIFLLWADIFFPPQTQIHVLIIYD